MCLFTWCRVKSYPGTIVGDGRIFKEVNSRNAT
jgi:hypothetical protein